MRRESLPFILDIFIREENYVIRKLTLEILQLEKRKRVEKICVCARARVCVCVCVCVCVNMLSRNLNPKINYYFVYTEVSQKSTWRYAATN